MVFFQDMRAGPPWRKNCLLSGIWRWLSMKKDHPKDVLIWLVFWHDVHWYWALKRLELPSGEIMTSFLKIITKSTRCSGDHQHIVDLWGYCHVQFDGVLWMAKSEPRRSKKETEHGLQKTGGTLLKCMLLYMLTFMIYICFFKRVFFLERVGGVGLMFGMFEVVMKNWLTVGLFRWVWANIYSVVICYSPMS